MKPKTLTVEVWDRDEVAVMRDTKQGCEIVAFLSLEDAEAMAMSILRQVAMARYEAGNEVSQ